MATGSRRCGQWSCTRACRTGRTPSRTISKSEAQAKRQDRAAGVGLGGGEADRWLGAGHARLRLGREWVWAGALWREACGMPGARLGPWAERSTAAHGGAGEAPTARHMGGWAPAMRACDSARDSRRSDSERHRPHVQPESIRAAPAGPSGLSRPQRCPAAGHAGGAPWAAGHGPHDSDSSGRGRSARHRAGAAWGPSERAGSKRGARAAAAALAAASSPSAPPAATAPHPSNPRPPSTPHHTGPRPTVAAQAPVRRASPAARPPAPDRVVRARPEGRGPGVTRTLSRTAGGPGVQRTGS